jgi:hypothetical protein
MCELEKKLENLQEGLAKATKVSTKGKLEFKILIIEEFIAREKNHQVSGFNKIGYHEIPSSSPGLGKKKLLSSCSNAEYFQLYHH